MTSVDQIPNLMTSHALLLLQKSRVPLNFECGLARYKILYFGQRNSHSPGQRYNGLSNDGMIHFCSNFEFPNFTPLHQIPTD